MSVRLNFVRQQGFRNATPESCVYLYPALMLQPRAVGVLLLIGLVFQPWPYFLALAALLGWNALLPRLNVFDALYNHTVASPRGLLRLGPAPHPRRFAQALAATMSLGIGLGLLLGGRAAAYALEAVLALAVVALNFGPFCLGSFLYHHLTGQGRFANRSLPWSRMERVAVGGAPCRPPSRFSQG